METLGNGVENVEKQTVEEEKKDTQRDDQEPQIIPKSVFLCEYRGLIVGLLLWSTVRVKKNIS